MGLFLEWLERKQLQESDRDWQTPPQVTADPLTSGMIKVHRRESASGLPFNHGAMSLGILMGQLGLTQPEYEAMKKLNLFVQDPESRTWGVDQNRFTSYFRQMSQRMPALSANSPTPVKAPAPPPVPGQRPSQPGVPPNAV